METAFEHKKNQRVVTFLDRNEVDFLDKLGKDALFSTGFKLSRAKLIAWMVDFTRNLKINGAQIKSENDLEEKLRKAIEETSHNQTTPATENKFKGGA